MHSFLSGPLTVEQLTVKIAGLSASLQGKKLVHLSDFHYDGLRLSDAMLEEAIAVSNQIQPDLVLLTGDYVTTTPKPIHQLALRLQKLQSHAGIYAILGNHDLYHKNSQTEITQALTQVGIHVLWNEIAYPLGKQLPIVGLVDSYHREFNPALIFHQLDPATPRIILCHNPDTAAMLQTWRVDLQLSGHTHGGQIVIPGFGAVLPYHKKIVRKTPIKVRRLFPFLFKEYFIVRHSEWLQGLHRIGKNQLYVNRGLGTYLPGRLFCPPELTVITLECG
ncbi:metallophosphoesterase [Anabaena subtropica]|uniref:Metallophosphoesterase n=1 Tax=Anabaena subtropica FACHB-260 TaxID=2692884 RepID=A0ABR8CMZ1_9NOST|nr:metallophosphoesterase [Anabaena subtropica]MBD2343724.1 metallophosphoesterase [Anabaena subtropica FACHB-260]